MAEQVILTLNAGSSSLKFALFTASGHPKRLWSGSIDRIGLPSSHFRLSDARNTIVVDEPGSLDTHRAALTRLLHKPRRSQPPSPQGYGVRTRPQRGNCQEDEAPGSFLSRRHCVGFARSRLRT
ncbi:hypothetical protein LCGC14_3078480 [marine sediment metagenome]|uniref:Butyrate kinase n=1 Tax=marine sediment metagenome TaxID=412755 RepID=A0A0F8Z4R0_9ZZZZ